jgi:hypothetical protein
MSFPYENEEQNLGIQIQRKIWLNSIYWGTSCGLLLYAVTNEIPIFVSLQSYLKQILSAASDAAITSLSVVAAILLLIMASAIFKYLCFGKNLWKMFAVTAVIVVLHTTVCIYGTFQRNETNNSEPLIINSKPRNAKMFKQIH